MKRKKILMASSNHWTSSFQVGSHHLARGFVEAGWDVAFVSSPISPLHFLGGVSQELCQRLAIYRAGGVYDLDDHLFTYVPGTLIAPHNKPVLRSERIHRNWMRLTLPKVVKKLKKAGFDEVDLLYFDNVLESFWLGAVNYKKSVLRVPDKNMGFERSTLAMQKMERELARTVDSVIYTAKYLESFIEEMQPKHMFHLPNGVNFKHFAEGSKDLPEEYKNIKQPIAVYVGAMDVWFDYALINYAAEKLPDVSFVLIGPDEVARVHLKKRPNIHLLGRKKYDDLPPYLHNANVGIIPFDVKGYPDLVHAIHPLKLYEYMACGLPVVSTEWDELKSLDSPSILCQTAEDFARGIADSISQQQDKEVFMQYAAGADWSERVKVLSEYTKAPRFGQEAFLQQSPTPLLA